MRAERDGVFRVVSYNIHRCVGADGACRPARIAQVLDGLAFDVAGLQEVESGDVASPPSSQLAELAHLTGSAPVPGATMFNPAGDYGNGLLVRGTSTRIVRHDLSVSGFEPRGALDVVQRTGSGLFRVIVTHLGLGIAERRIQVGKLLRILTDENPLPTLLLGDFNEWFPWAAVRRRLVERFGTIPLPRTFPAGVPLFALDHVWVRPRRLLLSLSAERSTLTRVASDHLPVLARVRLPERGSY
jgi:endonuclease/exonuclease/phosphatase family metal-dependent hydrolase